MKYHGTMKRNDQGILEIGGVDVVRLKETYGTPLYVYDGQLLDDTLNMFKDNFKHDKIEGIVAYASKAFLNVMMAQLVHEKEMSIDVASGGELYTVYKAGFDMNRVYFHGNNKTMEELEMALDLGCNVIVDNEIEADRLIDLTQKMNRVLNVYLRVNPGIDVLTHDYIKTSKLDSKFGVALESDATFDLISKLYACEGLNLLGLHAHIGSQIFQTEPFFENVNVLLSAYHHLKTKGIDLPSINIGGGFGVYYTKGDTPIALDQFLKALIDHVYTKSVALGLDIASVIIEPGRSVVSNAGSTLYTIGGVKETLAGKSYVFIDGGMSDNPRVALYQALYESEVVNKNEGEVKDYAIAGKLCESGDILSHQTPLRNPKVNDLLLMSSTGAYTFSMSSNYNRMLRPGVVIVRDGVHREMVRRQSFEDLVLGDLSL